MVQRVKSINQLKQIREKIADHLQDMLNLYGEVKRMVRTPREILLDLDMLHQIV